MKDAKHWNWGTGACDKHRGQSLPCQTCVAAGDYTDDAPVLIVTEETPLVAADFTGAEVQVASHWRQVSGDPDATPANNVGELTQATAGLNDEQWRLFTSFYETHGDVKLDDIRPDVVNFTERLIREGYTFSMNHVTRAELNELGNRFGRYNADLCDTKHVVQGNAVMDYDRSRKRSSRINEQYYCHTCKQEGRTTTNSRGDLFCVKCGDQVNKVVYYDAPSNFDALDLLRRKKELVSKILGENPCKELLLSDPQLGADLQPSSLIQAKAAWVMGSNFRGSLSEREKWDYDAFIDDMHKHGYEGGCGDPNPDSDRVAAWTRSSNVTQRNKAAYILGTPQEAMDRDQTQVVDLWIERRVKHQCDEVPYLPSNTSKVTLFDKARAAWVQGVASPKMEGDTLVLFNHWVDLPKRNGVRPGAPQDDAYMWTRCQVILACDDIHDDYEPYLKDLSTQQLDVLSGVMGMSGRLNDMVQKLRTMRMRAHRMASSLASSFAPVQGTRNHVVEIPMARRNPAGEIPLGELVTGTQFKDPASTLKQSKVAWMLGAKSIIVEDCDAAEYDTWVEKKREEGYQAGYMDANPDATRVAAWAASSHPLQQAKAAYIAGTKMPVLEGDQITDFNFWVSRRLRTLGDRIASKTQSFGGLGKWEYNTLLTREEVDNATVIVDNVPLASIKVPQATRPLGPTIEAIKALTLMAKVGLRVRDGVYYTMDRESATHVHAARALGHTHVAAYIMTFVDTGVNAIKLDLISEDQAKGLISKFMERHPKLRGWLYSLITRESDEKGKEQYKGAGSRYTVRDFSGKIVGLINAPDNVRANQIAEKHGLLDSHHVNWGYTKEQWDDWVKSGIPVLEG